MTVTARNLIHYSQPRIAPTHMGEPGSSSSLRRCAKSSVRTRRVGGTGRRSLTSGRECRDLHGGDVFPAERGAKQGSDRPPLAVGPGRPVCRGVKALWRAELDRQPTHEAAGRPVAEPGILSRNRDEHLARDLGPPPRIDLGRAVGPLASIRPPAARPSLGSAHRAGVEIFRVRDLLLSSTRH